jgi:uncharacterized protein involved in response to NO
LSSGEPQAHGRRTDPYRIFFPLGIALGVAGVAVWPLYGLGVTSGYSGRAHAFVQLSGFLYSFVAGFLLTAIPRFTGTEPPERSTQWALAAGLAATSAAYELRAFRLGHAGFLLVHVSVLVLAGLRVRRRRQSPPESFVLVGLGMLAGLGAAIVNLAVAEELLGPQWDVLGRRLLGEGMVLLLVLGVGGFLGPRLLGFAALPSFRAPEGAAVPPLLARRRVLPYAVAGAVVLGSVVLEYAYGIRGLAAVRAAAATIVVLVNVTPWRRPAARTTLAWCVWSAHWLLILGLWLVALAPAYRVDLLHVIFMGAFTLLILAVGLRVVLSHGEHGLAHEHRSWALRIGLVTGVFALAARIGAAFTQDLFFQHLTIAGLAWIAGILFWGGWIVRLILGRPPAAPQR